MSAVRHWAAALALSALGCASRAQTSSPAPRPEPAAAPMPAAPPPPSAAQERASMLAALRTGIDSMVANPEFRNAHWGILIVDPERADTLYSHDAGKLFMPASNMKIVTGSVALAQLGPDFRFRTTLVARGPVCDGLLDGDLAVNGRGDPTVSGAMRGGDAMLPLREMADSLAARGVKRIAGRVVAGDDVFPGPTLGYGWSWDDLRESYSAGVDELFFDEGFARVAVSGGRRVGARATVTMVPALGYPRLRASVRTAIAPESLAAGSGARGSLDVSAPTAQLVVRADSSSGDVVVSGWIAPHATDTLEVVFPDQDDAYLAAFRTALALRGITVGGRSTLPSGACGRRARAPMADTLVAYQSLPLRDVLHAMEKPSQNQIAELLLRTIGLERGGAGTPDSGIAVVKRQLLAWGVEPDGYVLHDGSGLSRYDYVTPETLVRTLAAIRRDTAFSAFYDALPIAGVDGTLERRMRGTPAEGNVHAKTGYVSNARSLSGYVTTADGRTLIFSALCNNWTAPVRDVEHVQDAIAVRLASLTLGGAP